MKPCEITCPKCGSADVHHRYRADGEVWSQNVYGFKSKFASGLAYTMTATAEHIEHHCRGCSYDWQTRPMARSSTTARKP